MRLNIASGEGKTFEVSIFKRDGIVLLFFCGHVLIAPYIYTLAQFPASEINGL